MGMATRRTPLAKTVQRGYGAEHRRGYAAQREQQWGRPCCRCGREMIRGQTINKDHSDDRQTYLGWSHRRCNIAASNRRRAALARARAGPTATRRTAKVQVEIEPGVWVVWQLPPRQHTRRW
jgi:hypothetical protein